MLIQDLFLLFLSDSATNSSTPPRVFPAQYSHKTLENIRPEPTPICNLVIYRASTWLEMANWVAWWTPMMADAISTPLASMIGAQYRVRYQIIFTKINCYKDLITSSAGFLKENFNFRLSKFGSYCPCCQRA